MQVRTVEGDMARTTAQLKPNVAGEFPCTGGVLLQPMYDIGSEIWDEELLVSLVDYDLMRMRCLLTRLVRPSSAELDREGRRGGQLRRSEGQRNDISRGVLIAYRQGYISTDMTKIYTHWQPAARPPEPATSRDPCRHLMFPRLSQPCPPRRSSRKEFVHRIAPSLSRRAWGGLWVKR